MLDPEMMRLSLINAGIFGVTLGALLGYFVDNWKGLLLFTTATAAAFLLLLHFTLKGAGGFTLLLVMLLIGLQWAYSFYYLTHEKLFTCLGTFFTPSLLLVLLLRTANQLETSKELFLILSLLILFILAWRGGRQAWRQSQGAKVVGLGWYGFCLLFEIGHHLAGPTGILALTIPTTLLFWGVLLVLARWYLLPSVPSSAECSGTSLYVPVSTFQFIKLRLKLIWQLLGEGNATQSTAERKARAEGIKRCLTECSQLVRALRTPHNLAMRSMLTFILGTNYPYIAVEERSTTTRVPGDHFKSILAGPGIILTPPDQTVAIGDGKQFKRVPTPGVVFTHNFESIQEVLDLRPQLRTFTVQAKTKDGIPVSVLAFVPHRLDPRQRAEEKAIPRLGHAYPFNEENIFKALHHEAVNYRREGAGPQQVELREKGGWDTTVPRKAQEILVNVLADYTFDELCASFDRRRDPRTEIRDRFMAELKSAVETDTRHGPLPASAWGIQIVGGGISNILPPDDAAWQEDTVWRARIDNWRTKWDSKALPVLAKGRAIALQRIQKARLESHFQLIERLAKRLQQMNNHTPTKDALRDVVAWYFADTIEEIIGDPTSQATLPPQAIASLAEIKGTVELRKGKHHPGTDGESQ
ncbi:MAG: SPFH domain-containing protein [Chloroflexota bacterium]|nr:SPFH domain-containing protein [Chloroflexota bacterium]